MDSEQGLTGQQVQKRLREYGHNRLRKKQQRSALAILFDQFKSVVLLLLLAAVYMPGLAEILKTVPPNLHGWMVIIALAFLPWGIGQLHRSKRSKHEEL